MDIFIESMRAILLDSLAFGHDNLEYLAGNDPAVVWAYNFLHSLATAIRERGK